jgi:hypothetical protein
VKEALEKRDREAKEMRVADQKAKLEQQLTEEKNYIPHAVGYTPGQADPFTLREDDAPEVIQKRKDDLKWYLTRQMTQKKETKDAREKEEKEFAALSAEEERRVRNAEAEAELARQREFRTKIGAALRKQMSEKVVDPGVVGYDDDGGGGGDRFTRGESAAELREKELERQRRLAMDYRKQIGDIAKRKEEEAQAKERDLATTIQADREELDFERRKEKERADYQMMYGKLLCDQMEATRTRRLDETTKERALDNRYTSLQIGEVPDIVDCERPYYRKKGLTKKDRLMWGF